MKVTPVACFVLLLAPLAATAQEPLSETWESAHVDGARIGSIHTATIPLDGGKRLRTTVTYDFSLKRGSSLLKLRSEQGTEETPDGKVVGVFMRHYQGSTATVSLVGKIDGGAMVVNYDNGRLETKVPWTEPVVGLYQRERMFTKKKPQPGDKFSFPYYEPTVNYVVTMRGHVRDPEMVVVEGKRQSLVRVDLKPDRIEIPGHNIQLPGASWWLDDTGQPVQREIELEGLGKVLLARTNKGAATAAVTDAPRIDIGLKSLVPLARNIPNPHATRAITYKVTVRDEDKPESTFLQDAHQEVKNARGNSFELVVHPVQPGARGKADAPGPEYLGASQYIDWEDARVKELARLAVGNEADPWKKSLRAEKWVNANMRADNAAPFGPVSQTARTLRGDCRMYATLTTAICRAAGVPSRTAIGLIYVERGGKPYLGFHMWTEVFIDGQWLGLDATLGQGRVGATHLKVTEHSWHDVQSLTPFMPINRVLGKLAVEVVRVEGSD